MNITHSLNGHPNTGRQAEIILEREKKNREKTPELLLIIYKNIAKGTRAFRTLIECFDSINNPCPNIIFILTTGRATSALTVIKCEKLNPFFIEFGIKIFLVLLPPSFVLFFSQKMSPKKWCFPLKILFLSMFFLQFWGIILSP